MNEKFTAETLIDFPDDALYAPLPITATHIDVLMAGLKARGIERVSWADYGDSHGGYFISGEATSGADWLNYERTVEALGNPLRVAVEAAHRHGLEIYGYFKPYETGPALVYPEGSPEARLWGRLAHAGGRLTWLDRFIVDHPHLRIRRRTDDGAVFDRPVTIASIELVKSDDAPTRITAADLQIWVSDLNYRYARLDTPFNFSDEVIDGRRVLTLSGLSINERHIVVTTGFTAGPGDFSNAVTSLLIARDAQGREISGCFASHMSVWRNGKIDFRESGLDYDLGFGFVPITLDAGPPGFIGFTTGRNAYLPGALCETEPEVQSYWLRWLDEMLATGVDGIDLREENHSTHTDTPGDYGYNPAVLALCGDSIDAATIAKVRGDAYTEFVRKARSVCNARGKKLRINFQADWYRQHPSIGRLLAYPANIEFQWRRWIDEGLLDEAVLRFYALPSNCDVVDDIAKEIVEKCVNAGIDIAYNRYIDVNVGESLTESGARIRADPRFSGFIYYEVASFVKFTENGCEFRDDVLPAPS